MLPVRDLLVSYSAGEMPLEALERLQRENCDALVADEILPVDAFRVANLLLSVALMKLAA
jgi:hypothetical protein